MIGYISLIKNCTCKCAPYPYCLSDSFINCKSRCLSSPSSVLYHELSCFPVLPTYPTVFPGKTSSPTFKDGFEQ